MECILKVERLKKSYGDLIAINDIDIKLHKGEVFGLLGANGAGKSTTIECILATKQYDSGQVRIFDLNPQTNRKKVFEKIGVQFQEASFQDRITVKELCEVTSSLYETPKDYMEYLKQFKLIDKLRNSISELSGGQRQRLCIVLALIPNPQIVFLDELTTGLDARSRRDVWNILRGLKEEGLSIFLTSHFMDEVESLCDHIAILKQGKIIFRGSVEEAVQRSPYSKFEDAYLWYTDEEVVL